MSTALDVRQPLGPRVIVALDFEREQDVQRLVEQLDPAQCRLKVGKELFTRGGPDVVRRLIDRGFEVFLDLKFHDIPNTTAQAVKAAAELGVWMVNVHTAGGRSMMTRCREVLEGVSRRPLLIGVTILTSLSDDEVREIGYSEGAAGMVERLARLGQDCGLDGVVCSAQEAAALKQRLGPNFCLVTPGIRPADASADDQTRIVTPGQAIRNGSDYLVVGRPITRAQDPLRALAAINQEIDAALRP